MVVMIKRSDPRMGETIFQLTNIQSRSRTRALFQVPSDYTVKQGQPRCEHGSRGPRTAASPSPRRSAVLAGLIFSPRTRLAGGLPHTRSARKPPSLASTQ